MSNYLTRQEIIAAGRLFDLHCKKLPGGICEYDEGWDDDTVHASIGTKATVSAVKRLRQELVGVFFKKTKTAEAEAATTDQAKIITLEANEQVHRNEIAALRNDYDALVANWNTLCLTLERFFAGSSEEGEIKHLKIRSKS